MKKVERKPAKATRQIVKKPSRTVAKKAALKTAARARSVPGRASQKNAAKRRTTAPAPAALRSSTDPGALAKRLQNLEDIMEISRLKASYCEAVDGGWNRRTHNGEAVASLFIEDGVWEVDRAGVRGEGHDGIVNIINSFQGTPFAFHRVSNPDIQVNGDQAIGNWHVIAYLAQPDGTPTMYLGVYRDQFVRTPRGWRFKRLDATTAYSTSLSRGWGIGEFYRQQATAPAAPENGPEAR